jgi:hypothetical protein
MVLQKAECLGVAMANIDEQSKKRLTESLNRLVTFGRNPEDKKAWNEARMALGELGDTAGGLLAHNEQEDVALTSSLSQLDGFMESLRFKPKGDEARTQFEVSLGDVEYRIKRLFGVAVR